MGIVIPWFGRGLRDGAEGFAWELALRLATRGQTVEVITTCCLSPRGDWPANDLPAGLVPEPEGFSVRRFPLVDRDREGFDAVNRKLVALGRADLRRGVSPLSSAEEKVFADELLRSPELLDHLAARESAYQVFIFLPCLCFTTLRGLPPVEGKAVLIPFLQHEAGAFLPLVGATFRRARRILYLGEAEARLAEWMFGPGIVPRGLVAGGELETTADSAGQPSMPVEAWDQAIVRCEAALHDAVAPLPAPPVPEPGEIHQVLPNLAYGDAISNEALWIRRTLRQTGFKSEIYALDIEPSLNGEAVRWQAGCVDPTAPIIYHHAIGSALAQEICAHPGPKALLYHNITPHHFFDPYLPAVIPLCRAGRQQLPQLAQSFPVAAGDSVFNAIELTECGFAEPVVLPLCIDPRKWNLQPDPGLMQELQDGRTNIVFVGRVVPNKRQEDLVFAFAEYRKLDPSARLYLIGTTISQNDQYAACLRVLVDRLGLTGAVHFAGRVDDRELAAYYSTAQLFWCMSEHEGFCAPLIEAMWFDVPVMAYAAGAVSETLGSAGSLFLAKDDPAALARQAHALVHDPVLRREVIDRQRERRQAFLPARVEQQLHGFVERLLRWRDRPAPAAVGATTEPLEGVREVAVVVLDDIGGLLLASPAFFSLKNRFPQARLTVVTAPDSAPVLRRNPYVDRVVLYDPPWLRPENLLARDCGHEGADTRQLHALLSRQFDLVVNLHSVAYRRSLLMASLLPHRYLLSLYRSDQDGDLRLITHGTGWLPNRHISRNHQNLLRTIGADIWCEPMIYFSEEDRSRSADIGRPTRDTVALALGAGVALKRWAPVKFRELARRLRGRGYPVAIVGSESDRRFSADWAAELGCLDLCGRFDLNEFAAYLAGIGCLVANESALMHVGAAVGIPVVCIIQPPAHQEFAPVGRCYAACMEPLCRTPCSGVNPDQPDNSPAFCRCVQSISVDQVEQNVCKMLIMHESGGHGAVTGIRTLETPLTSIVERPAGGTGTPVARPPLVRPDHHRAPNSSDPVPQRVAFVVQRAGPEVIGGSEALCLQIAIRMAAFWQVEILTTCALDYVTWENHYPAGVECHGDLIIRRFPVAFPRNIARFERFRERIAPALDAVTIEEGEVWMKEQGPWCPTMFEYLRAEKNRYDRFFFFTYLYCTSYFGLPLVADRAVLVPTAHDEWPMRLKIWDRWFSQPRAMIFNTIEEKEFLQKRFPQLAIDGPVAGSAVAAPTDLDALRFRSRYQIDGPFLLYVGRVDAPKGCAELIDYFLRLRETESAPRKLVLLGNPIMVIPRHPDILAPGFVSEQVKWDGLAACEFLVMPSLFESLSLVLLEAWAVGKAVLVNGNSAVLAGQCRRSGGGLAYRDEMEFRAAIKLLDDPARRHTMGESGQQFVDRHYRPEVIDEIYLRAGTATGTGIVPPT